jgi:hypothetical protein
VVDVLAALTGRKLSVRSDPFWDQVTQFTFGGVSYSIPYGLPTTLHGDKEEIDASFVGYVNGALKSSAVVFAVELVRMMVFSEARSMFRRLNKGRPGDLFSTPELEVMRRPGPDMTEGDLRTRAVLDVDLAGNHFALRNGDRIHRVRPDWMTIVLGIRDDAMGLDPVDHPESEVVGYLYHPGGQKKQEPIVYTADEVAHWAPIPDPSASYRGMSWMTPVLREISGDLQATSHKNKFFEQGATPNLIIKHQLNDPEMVATGVDIFKQGHEGVANAYKTLHLAAGADATVVGSNFQQLDFKAVQGAGETRIAAASGVGAVLAQFSEGMAGSSLNAGNYAAARRRVADGLFRPLWRSFAGAYESIVDVPPASELWYDERDIAFLREDAKDSAEIQSVRAQSIRQLTDAGFEADSVIKAIANDDMTLLVHSGLFSVQLQEPGTPEPVVEDPAPEPEPSAPAA